MTNYEIKEFISTNSEERLKDYFDSLVDKLQATNERNDKLTVLMGILIVIYFTVDLKIISQLSLGPISISDVKFFKLFIPLAFAYIFLLFATLNSHRAQLIKNIRQIGKNLFNLQDNIAEDTMYSNSFLRLIMPFSLWEELNSKMMHNGSMGCLSIFMVLPLFPLILAPFAFEYIALKELFINNWNKGWFDKTIIILTIWILAGALVYYFKLMGSAYREAKQDIN